MGTLATLPTAHSADCVGGCGVWLAAGTPSCRPYPCRCEDVDDDPPQWKRERAARSGSAIVYRCDPWISKKGRDAGQWVNRCPCWGMDPAGRPEGCCATSPNNPRLRVILDGVVVGQTPTIPPDREAGWRAPHERAEREIEIENVEVSGAYADALGIPLDVAPAPYVRRWTREELHCACPTPWDHMITKDGKVSKKGIGFHCCTCHANFLNSGVAALHRRSILEPCRDPAGIRDPERGTRVMRVRDVGGMVVWS